MARGVLRNSRRPTAATHLPPHIYILHNAHNDRNRYYISFGRRNIENRATCLGLIESVCEKTRQLCEETRQLCEVTRQLCEETRQLCEVTRQLCELCEETRQLCELCEETRQLCELCEETRQLCEVTRQL